MKFNKTESEKEVKDFNFSEKAGKFLGKYGMKTFLVRVLIAWSLIFFAFWIGSGCVGISNWDEHSRWALCGVLIFSMVPVMASLDIS